MFTSGSGGLPVERPRVTVFEEQNTRNPQALTAVRRTSFPDQGKRWSLPHIALHALFLCFFSHDFSNLTSGNFC